MDVEDFYDEKAPYYDGEYKTPFFSIYKEITWDNIKRFLPPERDSIILDAGGGTGEWGIRIAELGYKVVLTDISGGMLRQARLKLEEKNLEVELKKVDIRDMSCFSDETFDMALAEGDPLSYCGDAEKAVRELYRVLKVGGHCIASVDSLHYTMLKFVVAQHWDGLDNLVKTGLASFRDKFQVKHFTPESLKTLFRNAGFEVVRVLGKPVFLSIIPGEKSGRLLQNREAFEKILKLEMEYCDDPHIVGVAGHLEIVGRKAPV